MTIHSFQFEVLLVTDDLALYRFATTMQMPPAHRPRLSLPTANVRSTPQLGDQKVCGSWSALFISIPYLYASVLPIRI
jgi:hypothetical protein